MGKFDGKVALITGAGRMRGIGHGAAIAFAREGAHVTITGTGRDPRSFPPDERAAGWRDIETVAQEVRDLGPGALPLVADVTNAGQVQAMVDRTLAEFGRIDFLVNNASAPRLGAFGPLVDLSEEAWRKEIDVKVTGTFLCTQAVAQVLMRQGQGGSIVNLGSIVARIGRPNDVAYATACGAVDTFTMRAGKALAPHGIRVNAVNPGTTDTARNDPQYGYPRNQSWTERMEAVPLGRAAQPEEIGDFIAWLCSKEAEFIVGQCIYMDGGLTA
jgi:3-oxoacyl-[acyl-carrier protein] reductase/meso-butanediol dehydrogenase/(S,S)-butanediol dehydrogenase/diacetyl reductase